MPCVCRNHHLSSPEPHSQASPKATPGESESNTKRFRVYRNVMERMFGSDNFVHIASEQYSVYMLIRRTQTDLVDGAALMQYISRNYII